MSRRKFLVGIGGMAIASTSGILLAGRSRLTVGVIGGGIMGASIALHLAQAGADVIVFEKTAIASGATSKSFAWLNAFSDDSHYRDLRLQGLLAYQQLQKQMQLDITWGGSLLWKHQPEAAAKLSERAQRLNQAGYRMNVLGPQEFSELAPNLAPGAFETAVYAGLDGHLDPVQVTNKFIDQARKFGARVLYPCEVTDLKFSGKRLTGVATTSGEYSLDRLVIAAGVDTPGLAAKIGYVTPLKHAPGILAHSVPLRPLIRTVVEQLPVSFKQTSSGSIVGTDSYYAPEIPAHRNILQEPQDFPNEELRSIHGRRILDRITTMLPGARGVGLQGLTLGFRPLPEDGFPIVGYLPGSDDVYMAVTHSGVTLAAIMGEIIGREILADVTLDAFAPYRPQRFINARGH
ncbi:MAG: FAD-binding oxidoreductase [Gammaproteobacteria bacterium]|nr:FAD-binding oxidoreductase [Gammaproteobacteria bacterium]